MGWQFVKVLAWVDDNAPPPVGGGDRPPGIWGGGNVPMPTPPIANVPGAPGYTPPGSPPGIWGGGNVPMPTPPIANVPGAPGYDPNPPGIWGPPGPWPTPPIAPGGPVPPVDPGYGVSIEHPAHPIAPGGPPPVVMPPIYYPPEIWPDPNPPTIWPSPGHPEHPIVLPPPGGEWDPGAHPEHPIYWPPVIWPDPPEGLPSFDPDQLPQHPELPDLNHGVWRWIQDGDELVRGFVAQVVRPSQDLPDYQPHEPAEAAQPGKWVVVLLAPQRPAWAWVPSDPTPEAPPDNPHVPDMGAHPEHPIAPGGDGAHVPDMGAHPEPNR